MQPILTAGLGLKPQHFDDALNCNATGLWFEVHPENYQVAGGPRLAWLDAIRQHHTLSLHGVSMSLASAQPPDPERLRALSLLIDRYQPALVSEHLAWSTWRGHYYPDLLPVPRNLTTLHQVVSNIERMQDALGRQVAIENPSHYVTMNHEYSETDFLAELSKRTGCGLLVDINNVYISAHNIAVDASRWIDAIPAKAVTEIHLAGHRADADSKLLIDSHDTNVAQEVWHLYQRLVARTGAVPTLIERDDEIPSFTDLLAERHRAHEILALTVEKA